MSTWKNIWVVGQVQAMNAFLEAKKTEEGELPHEIFVVGPIYPQEQDGVDELGNAKYKRKAGQQLGLWCFSLHGDKQTLVEELRLLSNPNYVILENATLDDMIGLYPSYALGQGIPHIAGS